MKVAKHVLAGGEGGFRTMIDLFAGAGGMSLGLKAAGFIPIAAYEWNPQAAATYQANLSESLLASGFGPVHGDISKLSPRKMVNTLEASGLKMGDLNRPGDVDLISAGPPCQGFSRVGRGKLNSLAGRVGAFLHDPRNQLYRRALQTVGAVMPKAVLLENVPGILHLAGTNMAEIIAQALEDLGYNVHYTILNAAWFGVPQTRERVFILGLHRGLGLLGGPSFPPIQHVVKAPRGGLTSSDLSNERWKFYVPLSRIRKGIPNEQGPVTAEQAISDLPSFTKHLLHVDAWGRVTVPGFRSRRDLHPPVPYRRIEPSPYQMLMRTWMPMAEPDMVTDHFCRWVPRDFWTFAGMKCGDNYLEALKVAEERYQQAKRAHQTGELGWRPRREEFVPPYSEEGFHEKWKKLHRKQPSWTLTAHLGKDTYSHIHYDSAQARAITPREAARLQSFPDGFIFKGNAGDMYRQIGNAVPPLLAKALGECIIQQLEQAVIPKGRKASYKRHLSTRTGKRGRPARGREPIIA